MTSKFSSIPDERVDSDAVARAAMNAALKVPENRPLCEEMLKKAIESEQNPESKQPYSARAWRRAALVLAEAPMNLFSKEGEEILSYNHEVIGMPDWGKTTKTAYEFVKGELARRKLKTNSMLALPPEWRDDMLENDVRLTMACEVLTWIVKGYLCPSVSADPRYSTAYQYYIQYNHTERNQMLQIVLGLMGKDGISSEIAAKSPGLLIPQ